MAGGSRVVRHAPIVPDDPLPVNRPHGSHRGRPSILRGNGSARRDVGQATTGSAVSTGWTDSPGDGGDIRIAEDSEAGLNPVFWKKESAANARHSLLDGEDAEGIGLDTSETPLHVTSRIGTPNGCVPARAGLYIVDKRDAEFRQVSVGFSLLSRLCASRLRDGGTRRSAAVTGGR